MKRYLLLITTSLFFFACDKGENPVPKHESGNIVTGSINMSSDYRYQIYYDCETNTVVGQNLKTDWDLAFQSGETEWQVTLNTAKLMKVWETSINNITTPVDTTGANWRYDNVRGNLDSTAFGDWRINNPVYVVDRGYDHAGIHQGLAKIQISQFSTTQYQISIADLNGGNKTDHTIDKNDVFNKNCFSISSKSVVPVEPPKTDWDLVFSQYTHIYENGDVYLVTGVLQNTFSTQSAEERNITFDEINYDNLADYTFNPFIDVIGYDWKYYDFGLSSYVIEPVNYIVHTSSGHYFKLHFIDFYDEFGNKGNAKFEIQAL